MRPVRRSIPSSSVSDRTAPARPAWAWQCPTLRASRVSHASYASPVSRRTMLRIAALASSVVASIPNGVPLHQVSVRQPLQHPREHRLMRLDVDQPARARQGRMVRRCLVQREVQEVPDAQRIGRAPRDRALRVQALKIAEQQQPEIAPRRQTRPPEAVGIELRALRLDEGVEARVVEDAISAARRTDARHSSADPLLRPTYLLVGHASVSSPSPCPGV